MRMKLSVREVLLISTLNKLRKSLTDSMMENFFFTIKMRGRFLRTKINNKQHHCPYQSGLVIKFYIHLV